MVDPNHLKGDIKVTIQFYISSVTIKVRMEQQETGLKPGGLNTRQSWDFMAQDSDPICQQGSWVGVVFCLVPGMGPGGTCDLEDVGRASTLWVDTA